MRRWLTAVAFALTTVSAIASSFVTVHHTAVLQQNMAAVQAIGYQLADLSGAYLHLHLADGEQRSRVSDQALERSQSLRLSLTSLDREAAPAVRQSIAPLIAATHAYLDMVEEELAASRAQPWATPLRTLESPGAERYRRLRALLQVSQASLAEAERQALLIARGAILLAQLLAVGSVALVIRHLKQSQQRKAEAEHRLKRERYLQTLLQNATDLILLTDARGVIRNTSPAIERVLGMQPEEVRGASSLDFTWPGDRRGLQRHLCDLIRSPGTSMKAEARIRHADGSWRYAEAIVTNLLDDPDVSGLLVTLRDISELRDKQDRLQLIMSQLPALVWLTDKELTLTSLEGAALKEFALLPAELVGHSIAGPLQDLPEGSQCLAVHRAALAGESGEYYIAWHGRLFHSHLQPLRDASGGVIGVIGVGLDVTERRQMESALAQQEQLYALVAENSSDLIALYSQEGETLYVSPASGTILGYTPDEYAALPLREVVHPEDLSRVREARDRACQGQRVSVDFRILHRSGQYIWVETRTQAILADDGTVIQVQTSTRDITERVALQEKMAYAAFHDQLTGLPNRAAIIRELEQLLTDRTHPIILFFLDVDNFKLFNDSLGHQAGDQVLMEVSRRLTDFLQGDGMTGRLGGDEFVIVRRGSQTDGELQSFAHALIAAVGAPLTLGDQTIHITPSIGILRRGPEHAAPEDLLRDAALALHAAKKRGKACATLFHTEMQLLVKDRLLLENDLRRALEQGQFALHYQPILSLQDQRVTGFEALLRWNHPTRGPIPPAEFIPLAEETCLIIPVGAWVVETACRQIVTWHRMGLSGHFISVNLSPRQFQDPGLVDLVAETLRSTGLAPDLLQLEITESLSMADPEASAQVIRSLKRLGVRLAIDDFGTGYSSLKYLRHFPVDVLKLDRSFVSMLGRDAKDVELVRTVVALAASLGLKMVAEGVETSEQLAILRNMQCGSGQGFLLGRPAPPAEIERLMFRSKTVS